ncbi:MAG: NAD-binding protein [Candidatus Krumholzibacteria bacterium]|nr:NAD-binding protein [Candidatus Krumholzibacteria bacterium]
MKRSTRRLLLFLALLFGSALLASLFYMLGMRFLEGDPRSFWRSLMTVVESLTTTGFGSDNQWSHPLMNLYVIGMQILGLLLVFLFFPLYLIPVLEERFQSRLLVDAEDLSEHVILFPFRPAISVLLRNLEQSGVPSLILESDPREARRLQEEGHRVLYGRLEEGVLEAAGLSRARALIAAGRDDQNAAIALMARQQGFQGDVLSLAEKASHRRALILSGCTDVFTPGELLAQALATRASEKVKPTLEGVQQIGRHVEICEIRVRPDSEIAGKTLEESGLGAESGVHVIGQWRGGRLQTPARADTEIEAFGVLVVAGNRESIQKLESRAGMARPLKRKGHFIVAGYGEVGRSVVDSLREAGESVRVIDRRQSEGVDLVGDLLEPETQEALDLENAQGMVMVLDEDSSTLFATVMIRDMSRRLPLIARVNEVRNVERIHRAGADFALSLSQVAGRMLASRLLGEEAIEVDPQLRVLQVKAGGLAGQELGELDLRSKTGCSVVAVERGDEVLSRFGKGFRFEEGDAIFVCGSSEALSKYRQLYLEG